MSEHTPGPWTIESNGAYIMALNSGEKIIASVGDAEWLNEDDIANNHMIAAAPDMLEALEAVANKIPMQDRYIEDMVYDAIAKARGETA